MGIGGNGIEKDILAHLYMQVIMFKMYFPCFVRSESYELDVISTISLIENVLLESTCDNLNIVVLIGGGFIFD